MKRPSPYVPLSVHYADDEKIMAVGEDAELMYLRMLAYAGRTPGTNGWISEAVAMSRLGIVGRPGIPDSDPQSRAQRLEDHGLIERDGTGWRLTAWLRWNRSSEQIERDRERDRDRKSGNGTGNSTGNGTGNRGGFRGPDTDTETEEESEANVGADAPQPRPEVVALCTLLADLIEGNGSKRPNVTGRWHKAARLMLDADNRDPQQAEQLIRWTQASDFWRSNVMSMAKFREKYDTLRLQAERDGSLIAPVSQLRADRPRRNGLAFVPTCPTCGAPPENVHDPECPDQSWRPNTEGIGL